MRDGRKRTHKMDFWKDMTIRVDKASRMGVKSSLSRSDFRRICRVHDELETMNFLEIRVTKNGIVEDKDETDFFEAVEEWTEQQLRTKAIEILGSMRIEDLKRALPSLLSFSRRSELLK